MPIGVPVPETMAVSLTFYGREEKDGRDFIGPMPLRLGSPMFVTIRLMPRY